MTHSLRHIAWISIVAGSLATSSMALASGDRCTDEPRDKWLSEEQITEKAKALGYDVRSVKIEDECWEIKGFDKDGKRAEVYFHPVTAEIEKVKGE